MQVGRGLSVWLLCLSALLLGYLGAKVNPVVYLLVGVLTPLPVLMAGRGLGERAAWVLALAVAACIFALQPGLKVFWDNLGFFNLLFLGVLLSSLQSRGLPAPQAIIISVLVFTLLALLLLTGQAVLSGQTIQAILDQRSTELLETVRQLLGESGAAGSLVPGVPQGEAESLLRRLMPGLLVTNLGLVAWINVILSRQLSLLLWGQEPEPPLFYWAVPEWLIFAILGAGFLLLVPIKAVRFFSLNLALVLTVLYFCQGVAVVAAWFHRLGIPRFLRMVGYPVLFLNPFFFVIIILGLLDLWLDFRRLHRPKDA